MENPGLTGHPFQSKLDGDSGHTGQRFRYKLDSFRVCPEWVSSIVGMGVQDCWNGARANSLEMQ